MVFRFGQKDRADTAISMVRRPRVCMLRHSYFPFDVGSRRQAAVLVAAGFEVDVICLRGPLEPARERVHGADVYRLPIAHRRGSVARYVFQYGASLVLFTAMAAMLHVRRRYDAIQVYTMPDALTLAAAIPKLLGAKVVLHMQDLMPELYRSKYGASDRDAVVRLLALQEGAGMRLADRVITVTDEFKAILVARHRRKDIDVIMNCPDDALFPRRAPSLPYKRSNGHRDPFIVISHGVLLERLGYDTIVKAVALLREAIPELEVRLAGAGEYRDQLVALVRRLGVDDRVHLLGHVPLEHVPALIATADIGVVANRRDGFADLLLPTKLLEYVWMGIAVLAARTPTIEHYFNERMVSFFEPGDEQDLAQRILGLYREPRRRLELAANATTFFEAHNWPAEQARYRRIIGEVLARSELGRAGDALAGIVGGGSKPGGEQ